jgi:hypothetical protein
MSQQKPKNSLDGIIHRRNTGSGWKDLQRLGRVNFVELMLHLSGSLFSSAAAPTFFICCWYLFFFFSLGRLRVSGGGLFGRSRLFLFLARRKWWLLIKCQHTRTDNCLQKLEETHKKNGTL